MAEASWLRRPGVVDPALAAATSAALMVQVAVAGEEGARPPDPLAYLLAAAVGASLLLRRRYPWGVLAVSIGLVFLYHVLGYPAIGAAVPLAIALFNASLAGRLRAAVSSAAFVLVWAFGWLAVAEDHSLLEVLSLGVYEGSVMGGVILAGYAFRSRRLLLEETRERVRLAGIHQAADAERRLTAERMRIARELHDVVAHTVAVIGVQARVAADSLDNDPEQARRSLDLISGATREATAELRSTIELLRQGDERSLEPAPGLHQLESLSASIRAAGLPVELTVDGEPGPVAGAVELTAYRVVQESLTNAVRHSGATRATVHVTHRRGGLSVVVEDDGRGAPDGLVGHGIRGMRERVEAVGGTFQVTSPPGRGVKVEAVLPSVPQ